MEIGTNSRPSSGPSYEVFLNFRGADTRNTFTAFLYHHMITAGINVFRDNESLHVGEKIRGELLQAIENSQIYIPIFSENYASSCWCLRELTHMVECTAKSNGNKEILPIFLDIKPADVKLKTNWYESKRHKTFSSEEESWKKALIEVAKIKGWTWNKDESQVDLIQSVIQIVTAKLNVRSQKMVSEHLVGVDDQVKDIIKKLNVGSDVVCFLGIHGMGGIGKTTLAKVVFNQLSSHFKDCHFLSDIGESSRRHGIKELQKQLLSKFSHSSSISDQIDDLDDGINMIKKVLFNKKVLIVLDDVDGKEQLRSLAGKGSWFGAGSRIIITTRDQSVLKIEEEVMDEGSIGKSTIILTHEVDAMEFDHALKLFSRHAFRSDFPPNYYASLSKEVVSTLGKLPSALEIVGSSLLSKSKTLWVDTLRKLKEAPPIEVRNKLMKTYESLDHSQKQVFLDIACFFVGEDKTYPCYMWDACGYCPHDALEVLFLRSLIKIKDNNTFWMHNQVRDLGRNIVLHENFDDPGGRSRVWNCEEGLNILKRKEGSQRINALSLGFIAEDSLLLADFPKLRFFQAYGAFLVGDFNNLLSSLVWLTCKLRGPTDFCPANLVVLDLSYSRFSEEGVGWIKAARKLKVLNLSYCPDLMRTPDLSTLVSLEILDLEGCSGLVEIDPSVGELQHLITLNLRGCSALRELPKRKGCLQTSTGVVMPFVPHEFEFQPISSNLKSLLTLDLSGTQISKLPHSIGRMVNIVVLRLCDCRNIEDLPDWVWNLPSLIELDLSGTCISHLSDSIGNLKQLTVLRMRGIRELTELPSTIWLLEKLEVLDANRCMKLTGDIPEDIERLSCLRILDLLATQLSGLPTTLSRLSNLQELKLYLCYPLRHLPELPPNLTRLTLGGDIFALPPSISTQDSVTTLPTNISTLTQLEFLFLHAMHVLFLPRLPSSLRELQLEDLVVAESPNFSNLKNLSTLDFEHCSMPEFSGIFDAELEKLSMCSCIFTRLDALFQLEMKRLTSLSLSQCEFRPEIVDLSHMKNLRGVGLLDCKLLVEIRGLEELGSLSSLTVWDCSSIERISDLSKLRKLQKLTVVECPKLRSLEGLNHLKSLEKLRIRDCQSLKSLADTSNLDLFCLKIVGCQQLPDRANYCKRGRRCNFCSFILVHGFDYRFSPGQMSVMSKARSV